MFLELYNKKGASQFETAPWFLLILICLPVELITLLDHVKRIAVV